MELDGGVDQVDERARARLGAGERDGAGGGELGLVDAEVEADVVAPHREQPGPLGRLGPGQVVTAHRTGLLSSCVAASSSASDHGNGIARGSHRSCRHRDHGPGGRAAGRPWEGGRPCPQTPMPDFGAMFAVHDAVRRDLARAVSLTGGTGPLTGPSGPMRCAPAGCCCAASWPRTSRPRTQVLWPRLRAVRAGRGGRRRSTSRPSSTGRWTRRWPTTTRWLAEPDAFADRAHRERLTGALEHVAVRADQHFGLEERRLLPLRRRLAGAGGLDDVRRRPGRRRRAPVASSTCCRSSSTAPTPTASASVLAGLDPQQRAAYADSWRPTYRAVTADLW